MLKHLICSCHVKEWFNVVCKIIIKVCVLILVYFVNLWSGKNLATTNLGLN